MVTTSGSGFVILGRNRVSFQDSLLVDSRESLRNQFCFVFRDKNLVEVDSNYSL
jgi:hypothetical protein